MKSRVHPKYKTKYRVGNWSEYDRTLVQRGDIKLWISTDATDAWKPAPSGRRGGQRKFSDHAIETALTLRLGFKLPLRQAEGFLRSVLSLMGLDLEAPDHTTLSRRGQHLDVKIRLVPTGEATHLIIDSTGLSIVGEGEWAVPTETRSVPLPKTPSALPDPPPRVPPSSTPGHTYTFPRQYQRSQVGRFPCVSRVCGDPQRDVARPHERTVVLSPVADSVLRLVLRMHSRFHAEIVILWPTELRSTTGGQRPPTPC